MCLSAKATAYPPNFMRPKIERTEVSEEVDTVSPPAQIRELDEESVWHLWLMSKGLAGRWEHRAG